jgi:hypothetical protein
MGIEVTPSFAVLTLAWLLLLTFLALAVADAILGLLRVPSIGARLHLWTRHYPAFTAALIFILGALIGHFFTHGL